MPLLSPFRLAGVVVLFGAMLFYDPAATAPWVRLGLPVLMALGAWLMAQSLMPVLLVAVVLSLIHADLTADDALRRLGYPLIAAVAGSALLALLWHRFRQRIRRTRAERWRDRTSGDAANGGSACGGSPR